MTSELAPVYSQGALSSRGGRDSLMFGQLGREFRMIFRWGRGSWKNCYSRGEEEHVSLITNYRFGVRKKTEQNKSEESDWLGAVKTERCWPHPTGCRQIKYEYQAVDEPFEKKRHRFYILKRGSEWKRDAAQNRF